MYWRSVIDQRCNKSTFSTSFDQSKTILLKVSDLIYAKLVSQHYE